MLNTPIVTCPECMAAYELENGSEEVRHLVCVECDKTLVIVWTDTMLLAHIAEWSGQPSEEGGYSESPKFTTSLFRSGDLKKG
jgi:hypothetical protein